jgi:hypothetical protein
MGIFYYHVKYRFTCACVRARVFVCVKVSLICSFCLLKSCMWKRSSVFLMICPFFLSVVFPLCPRLYCVHVLCLVSVEHILKFVFLLLCSGYLFISSILSIHWTLVDIQYILVGIIRFDYICPLICSFRFSYFFRVLVVMKAIPMW